MDSKISLPNPELQEFLASAEPDNAWVAFISAGAKPIETVLSQKFQRVYIADEMIVGESAKALKTLKVGDFLFLTTADSSVISHWSKIRTLSDRVGNDFIDRRSGQKLDFLGKGEEAIAPNVRVVIRLWKISALDHKKAVLLGKLGMKEPLPFCSIMPRNKTGSKVLSLMQMRYKKIVEKRRMRAVKADPLSEKKLNFKDEIPRKRLLEQTVPVVHLTASEGPTSSISKKQKSAGVTTGDVGAPDKGKQYVGSKGAQNPENGLQNTGKQVRGSEMEQAGAVHEPPKSGSGILEIIDEHEDTYQRQIPGSDVLSSGSKAKGLGSKQAVSSSANVSELEEAFKLLCEKLSAASVNLSRVHAILGRPLKLDHQKSSALLSEVTKSLTVLVSGAPGQRSTGSAKILDSRIRDFSSAFMRVLKLAEIPLERIDAYSLQRRLNAVTNGSRAQDRGHRSGSAQKETSTGVRARIIAPKGSAGTRSLESVPVLCEKLRPSPSLGAPSKNASSAPNAGKPNERAAMNKETCVDERTTESRIAALERRVASILKIMEVDREKDNDTEVLLNLIHDHIKFRKKARYKAIQCLLTELQSPGLPLPNVKGNGAPESGSPSTDQTLEKVPEKDLELSPPSQRILQEARDSTGRNRTPPISAPNNKQA